MKGTDWVEIKELRVGERPEIVSVSGLITVIPLHHHLHHCLCVCVCLREHGDSSDGVSIATVIKEGGDR